MTTHLNCHLKDLTEKQSEGKYEIYEWKEHVTLSSLLIKLEDEGLFSGKWTKLAELLKEMGFSYKKQDNRRYYYEQPRIIEQRHTYLCKIMHNRV